MSKTKLIDLFYNSKIDPLNGKIIFQFMKVI